MREENVATGGLRYSGSVHEQRQTKFRKFLSGHKPGKEGCCPACGQEFDIKKLGTKMIEDTLMHDGKFVELHPFQGKILRKLLKEGGKVVTYEAFLMDLYDRPDDEPDNYVGNTIKVHITRLRQKLKAAGVPLEVLTWWGRGYSVRMVGIVEL